MIKLKVKNRDGSYPRDWMIPEKFFDQLIRNRLIYQWDDVIWLCHTFIIDNQTVPDIQKIPLNSTPPIQKFKQVSKLKVQSEAGNIDVINNNHPDLALDITQDNVLYKDFRVLEVNEYDLVLKDVSEKLQFLACRFEILPSIVENSNLTFPDYDVEYLELTLRHQNSHMAYFRNIAGYDITYFLKSLSYHNNTLFSPYGIVLKISGDVVNDKFVKELSKHVSIRGL